MGGKGGAYRLRKTRVVVGSMRGRAGSPLWTIPRPAVMHWTPPSRMTPWLPTESRCSISPWSMMEMVEKPRCGWSAGPGDEGRVGGAGGGPRGGWLGQRERSGKRGGGGAPGKPAAASVDGQRSSSNMRYGSKLGQVELPSVRHTSTPAPSLTCVPFTILCTCLSWRPMMNPQNNCLLQSDLPGGTQPGS